MHPSIHSNSSYYSPFGLFIGYFDDSRSLRSHGFDGTSVRKRFSECYRRLQNKSELPDGGEAVAYATLFGHYDELAFALVENFSDFARLTSWIPELESYTLSLCPTLSSLAGGQSPIYCVDAPVFLKAATAVDFAAAQEKPAFHDKAASLLSVTHLRIAGLATMRYGIEMQAAVAELIIERIESLLAKGAANADFLGMSGLVSEGDFAATRVCLVEPLSSDDLTLLISTTNYSVAGAIVAALRHLALRDVFEYDQSNSSPLSFRARLASHGRNDAVRSRSKPDLKHLRLESNSSNSEDDCDADLKVPFASSLFTSTYTSLGAFARADCLGSLRDIVNGAVSVYGVADTTPEHDHVASHSLRNLRPSGDGTLSHEESGSATSFRYVHPGHHDVTYSYTSRGFTLRDQPIRTADVFDVISVIYGGEASSQKHFEGAEDLAGVIKEGVLDLSTHLAIPIHPEYQEYHAHSDALAHFFGSISLAPAPFLSKGICLDMTAVSDWLRRDLGIDNPYRYEQLLRQKLNLSDSACAVAMRATNDFLTALADPARCDEVLDLVDAFQAFASLLRNVASGEKELQFPLWNARVRSMRQFAVEYISGLSSALQARIGRATPRHDGYFARDDVRGSLGDLFLSSEAVVKCCAGAFRVALFGQNIAHNLRVRSCVGGVMSAQLNQRAMAWISAHPETDNYMLSIAVDASNLFRTRNLIGVVHEFGHLLYASLYPSSVIIPLALYDNTYNELGSVAHDSHSGLEQISAASHIEGDDDTSLDRWVAEVFAELFVRVLVFAEDEAAFTASAIDAFRARVAEVNDHEIWEGGVATAKLVGQYVRLWHVNEMWNSCFARGGATVTRSRSDFWRELFEQCSPPEGTVGSTWEEFSRLLNAYDVAFPMPSLQLRKLVAEPIADLYSKLFPVPPGSSETDEKSTGWAEDCLKDLHRAHSTGTPFPLYFGADGTWDESQLVFAVLRASAERCCCDTAPSASGQVPMSTIQDSEVKRLFLEQACHYKTLWHVSARQRCRRLLEIWHLMRIESTGGKLD